MIFRLTFAVLVALAFTLATGCESTPSRGTPSGSNERSRESTTMRKVVVVVDAKDISNGSQKAVIERQVENQLNKDLRSLGFVIVDRTELNRVLEEQKLTLDDITENGKPAGNVKVADGILVVYVNKFRAKPKKHTPEEEDDDLIDQVASIFGNDDDKEKEEPKPVPGMLTSANLTAKLVDIETAENTWNDGAVGEYWEETSDREANDKALSEAAMILMTGFPEPGAKKAVKTTAPIEES